MLMINLKEHTINDIKEYKTVNIKLDLYRSMELLLSEFSENMNEQLLNKGYFDDLSGAVYFYVQTDLSLEDLVLIQDFLINSIVARFTLDEIPFFREKRLSAPTLYKDRIDMQNMAMMDLVNKHPEEMTHINMTVATRNGKYIFDIIRDEAEAEE